MPRPVKKAKARAPKEPSADLANGVSSEPAPVSTAVAGPPPAEPPPLAPASVEPGDPVAPEGKPASSKRRERPAQPRRPELPAPVAEEVPEPDQKPERRGQQ